MGQTYGSARGIFDLADAPDLILVEADSGVEGYVRKTELQKLDGSQVSGPREVNRHSQFSPTANPALTVYASDGVTVIGVWHLRG